MAAIADCVACHTLHNRPGTEVNGKLFGGGNRFTSPLGTIFTPNITLDASGIGY
jgi:hypothetical protein